MIPKTGLKFYVVVNHEEQYRVLPESYRIPAGYKAAGMIGTREECLEYVKKVWKSATPEDWKDLLNSIK